MTREAPKPRATKLGFTSIVLSVFVPLACAATPSASAGQTAPPASEPSPAPERFVESLPGTRLALTMVRVPARADAVGGFWISTTEIPWEAYDVLVFGLDDPALARETDADAFSRPSKPYIPMDRGFGHDGRPAISMSLAGAEAFCAFLSARTGRTWRLPTEREWEHAAAAGSAGRWCTGDDPAVLDTVAWYRSNAQRKTQPVATKAPNAFGLYDVHGNVAEWCLEGDGSDPERGVVKGGSYADGHEALALSARKLPSPTWNASDPQNPKSRWWLADAGMIGFRVVCDAPPRAP